MLVFLHIPILLSTMITTPYVYILSQVYHRFQNKYHRAFQITLVNLIFYRFLLGAQDLSASWRVFKLLEILCQSLRKRGEICL